MTAVAVKVPPETVPPLKVPPEMVAVLMVPPVMLPAALTLNRVVTSVVSRTWIISAVWEAMARNLAVTLVVAADCIFRLALFWLAVVLLM